jgi:hypothetical protein
LALAAYKPHAVKAALISWIVLALRTSTSVLRGHEELRALRLLQPRGTRIVTVGDKTARIWDVRLTRISAKLLLTEACARLSGLAKLTRDEMRLAAYPDSMPDIDVCRE